MESRGDKPSAPCYLWELHFKPTHYCPSTGLKNSCYLTPIFRSDAFQTAQQREWGGFCGVCTELKRTSLTFHHLQPWKKECGSWEVWLFLGLEHLWALLVSLKLISMDPRCKILRTGSVITLLQWQVVLQLAKLSKQIFPLIFPP